MRKIIVILCIFIGIQSHTYAMASVIQMYQLLKDTAVEIAHLANISQLLEKLNVISEQDNKILSLSIHNLS